MLQIVTLWYRAPEILLGDALYGCSVDMWSMGCIFAEMVTGTPLFRGDSGIDQLFHIFRIMGVPTEENWPDITMLRNYSPNSFPSWYANRLYSEDKIMHALDAKGFDLLTVSGHCFPSHCSSFLLVINILLNAPLVLWIGLILTKDILFALSLALLYHF